MPIMGLPPPARHLLEPVAVVESVGTPEFFAHGRVFRAEGETMEIIFFSYRMGEAVEVFRVHIPMGAFLNNPCCGCPMVEARVLPVEH